MTRKDDEMEDQQLLVRLADTAREADREEHQGVDPRWDELAAGSLSTAEVEALRTDSKRRLGANRTAELFDLFNPLGTEFQQRVRESIREQSRFAASATQRGERQEPTTATPPATPRLGWRRASGWLAAAAVVLVAGTLLLRERTSPTPLVEYTPTLAGAVVEQRGPADPGIATPYRFVTGNRFALTLRPATSVAKPVEVRTFLTHRGALRPWPVAAQVAASGAVSIAGRVPDEIPLPTGRSQLWVVVARTGELPRDGQLIEDLGGRHSSAEGPICEPLTPSVSICQVSVLFEE